MNHFLLIVVFSILGFLFSGYFAVGGLVTGSCLLIEGCHLFMGLPSCVYFFITFSFLLVVFLLILIKGFKLFNILVFGSALGVLFSIYFIIIDLFFITCSLTGCLYSFGLPLSVYFLVFYLVIFVSSLRQLK